jgi:hypothetical protein
MRPATAAEAAEVHAAVAELRRQYRAAGARVAANTSGLFNRTEKQQVAGAFAAVGQVLEKWATVHKAAALSGRWADGRSHTVAAFLDFGRKEIADAVEKVAGEAYDRGLFAAVRHTVEKTAEGVNPLNWPPGLKLAAGVGVAVVLVLAVAVLARR